MLWFGWAVFCAWAIRVAVVVLLFRRLGGWSYFVAYLMWAALAGLGAVVAKFAGYEMYAPQNLDGWQQFGSFVVWMSPLGLPLLAGAPVVLLLDLLVLLGRVMIGRR